MKEKKFLPTSLKPSKGAFVLAIITVVILSISYLLETWLLHPLVCENISKQIYSGSSALWIIVSFSIIVFLRLLPALLWGFRSRKGFFLQSVKAFFLYLSVYLVLWKLFSVFDAKNPVNPLPEGVGGIFSISFIAFVLCFAAVAYLGKLLGLMARKSFSDNKFKGRAYG